MNQLTDKPLRRLSRLVNRAISLDPDSQNELSMLAGRVMKFEYQNTGFRLYLLPQTGCLEIYQEYSGDVDVTVKGTPFDMLSYIVSEQGKTGKFAGTLEITGDIGLAQQFQTILKNMDLDWEEEISRWFGDTMARKSGNIIRETISFLRNTRQTLALDISEYLLYEKEILPMKNEIQDFNDAIDQLRNDVERLTVRIKKIHNSLEMES